MWLGIFPWGMWCLAAERRVRRNRGSPVLQEEGNCIRANASSVSRVNDSQSAFRKLVKVKRGGMGGLESKGPPRYMRIGRWSELRVVWVLHSRSVAIWGVAMERSGEVGLPWEGSRVGVSEFSRTRSEEVRQSSI